jgi:hypothetical protein
MAFSNLSVTAVRPVVAFAVAALLGVGGSAPCRAQEFWTGITVRAKVTKLVSAQVEQQVRFAETIGAYKSAVTEASLRLRPWEHLGGALSYRFTDRAGSGRADDNDRRRWSADGFYTIGSGDTQWLFTHRVRYQQARTPGEANEEAKTYLRNRLQLTYNLTKRVQPYASGEVFYRFNGRNENQLNRFTLGLETRIGKKFTLDTFFPGGEGTEREVPETAYVVGVTGLYRLSSAAKTPSAPKTVRLFRFKRNGHWSVVIRRSTFLVQHSSLRFLLSQNGFFPGIEKEYRMSNKECRTPNDY